MTTGSPKSRTGWDASLWTVCIISVRDPRTDFRRDLADALRRLGATVVYIRLGRRCWFDEGKDSRRGWRSPYFILRYLASLKISRTCVVLSVNTGFPLFSLLMRIACRKAVWLFDEHDDLLYDTRGLRRVAGWVKLRLFRSITHRSLCVSPNLCARVPSGETFPNASSIHWTSRTSLDCSKVVILSNIDERFDFHFVQTFLDRAPDVEVHLFGARSKRPDVIARFSDLSRSANLIHRGPYAAEDIQRILDAFSVMLVPYLVDQSTLYIDPLRFYHALNNGLEVITSSISRAHAFHEQFHLVDDGIEAATRLHALRNRTCSPRNRSDVRRITWDDRALDLLVIATSVLTSGRRSASGSPDGAANRALSQGPK